jgi:hypothetical protein
MFACFFFYQKLNRLKVMNQCGICPGNGSCAIVNLRCLPYKDKRVILGLSKQRSVTHICLVKT